MFQDVPGNVRFPELEEEILQFWKERQIYEQSLQRRAGAPKFVFYEGPPTANGMPHPGHCLTRAIKDLFPRYRTMRGFLCERKGGWDTHGLPVEVEVCKELGIHSKEEIEAFGVEPFIQKCQQSVWRYMKEWERLTERLGFWIHLDEAYVTYHQSYVESVWWSLKNLFDRGLLYQGHKIVWWWAQGGTALSSGEVGEGYREVADPSVYVKFPLLDDDGNQTDTSLLVWTTTPWTLPSNQFAAVKSDLEYSTVVDPETGEKLILASALVETIASKVKRELTLESTCAGTELVGRRYLPPFDYYYKKTGVFGVLLAPEVDEYGQRRGKLVEPNTSGQHIEHIAWRVVPADFVTTDSGTGVVHQAPAFGEVDYEVLIRERNRFEIGFRPELLNAVGPDGRFTSEAPDYEGRWVKEADKDITRAMRERGILYHQDQYIHDYPFCPRAEEDALIQYPRKSWFIRTTEFKDRMLENNRQINWLPDHIRDGRMGNFLETNVDWALSRERYWGTPLPIWVCNETGKMEAIANYDELLAKPGIAGTDAWETAKREHPELPDDLRIHKPYIDEVTYDSPFAAGARMQRVTEVIDCWYDAGSMPFAQWGFPRIGREQFEDQFPADFISEALDQTRGWFYALLAISTLAFSDENEQDESLPQPEFPHPFANCIVLGLMLAESHICTKCGNRHLGQVKKCEECGGKVERKIEKMSKRLRNYREPQEIFDQYGADALRWYFFANQPPWNSIIYSERAIKESIPEFLLRLWNVYSFFVIYAKIDGFDPAQSVGGDVEQLTNSELLKSADCRPLADRGELDRWLLSELNRTTAAVVEQMDAYDNYSACQHLNEFIDALSNWYVRRSRDRFWSGDERSQEKIDAYWTLYECLLTTSKLIAPFTPFLAEGLWRNLTGVFGDRVLESVHLCDYPTADSAAIDELLSDRMKLLREIASLGRSARANAKLKVRQPLAKVEVILADSAHQSWLEEHDELLREELNVKSIEYTKEADKYITYEVQPNFKRLGPRVGPLMPKLKAALANADGGPLLAEMSSAGKVTIEVEDQSIDLDQEDIQIRLNAKEGWTAAQGSSCVVVLSSEITPSLFREGLANDLVRLIQQRRKDLNCNYTDRIEIGAVNDSADLRAAIEENLEYICRETLAVKLDFDSLPGADPVEHQIGDFLLTLDVRVVK